jgi:hypothetical protein
MSRRFTFPWKSRSGFLEAIQLLALVELLTEQLVAIVRNPKTNVAWLLLAKVTLMGMVCEKIVFPLVEFVTRIVIIPVRVLAVVSTVRVAEMDAVILSNETVLENVIVWVVAWTGDRAASIISVVARVVVLIVPINGFLVVQLLSQIYGLRNLSVYSAILGILRDVVDRLNTQGRLESRDCGFKMNG